MCHGHLSTHKSLVLRRKKKRKPETLWDLWSAATHAGVKNIASLTLKDMGKLYKNAQR